MRVLILFASTEGQTAKIAHFVAERVEAAGHMAIVVDASEVSGAFESPAVDAAIVAGSVHIGRYQSELVHVVKKNAERLTAIPTLFLSISMAAAGGEKGRSDARPWLDRFLRDTGWTPGRVEHVAGALKYREYGLVTRWIMRFISARQGLPTDTSRDYEFTDWGWLEQTVGAFVDAAGG